MPAADPAPARTRVLLIDRHPVSLRGLAREAETSDALDVVAAVVDPTEGVLLAQELQPDVVVYGATSDDADPVGTTRAVRAVARDAAVLVLGGPEPLAGAAIAAGASGFVAKSAPVPLILGAIVAVGRGETVVGRSFRRGDPGAAEAALPESPAPPTLTVREWEVLHLLEAGCNAAQIGDRLFISRNTARNYVQNVITKLGAHSKLEAVAIARRSGLLGDG
jgi:DNA-binding NarL/FixJ family response regulator